MYHSIILLTCGYNYLTCPYAPPYFSETGNFGRPIDRHDHPHPELPYLRTPIKQRFPSTNGTSIPSTGPLCSTYSLQPRTTQRITGNEIHQPVIHGQPRERQLSVLSRTYQVVFGWKHIPVPSNTIRWVSVAIVLGMVTIVWVSATTVLITIVEFPNGPRG
jgi:hypothetical protein